MGNYRYGNIRLETVWLWNESKTENISEVYYENNL